MKHDLNYTTFSLNYTYQKSNPKIILYIKFFIIFIKYINFFNTIIIFKNFAKIFVEILKFNYIRTKHDENKDEDENFDNKIDDTFKDNDK